MSKKRRREPASAQSQSVEIYEDLAHEHAEIRLKAAKKLLNSINDDQNPSHSEVETVVKRLIRGLCSARKSARFGYAVALTELLMQLWGPDATQGEKLQLSVSDILTLVEEQTETASNFTTAVRDRENEIYRWYTNLVHRRSKTTTLVESSPRKRSSSPKSCFKVGEVTSNGSVCWTLCCLWQRRNLG